MKLLATLTDTGDSENKLDATIEGQDLELAFNVRFMQVGLTAINTKNVTIETNVHNIPAVLHSTGDEENLYVYCPCISMEGR